MNHPGDFDLMFVSENQRRRQQEAERERLAKLAREGGAQQGGWWAAILRALARRLRPADRLARPGKPDLRRRRGW